MRPTMLLLAAALTACQAAGGPAIRPEVLTQVPLGREGTAPRADAAPAGPGPWIPTAGADGTTHFARVVAGELVAPGASESRLALPDGTPEGVRAYRAQDGDDRWTPVASVRDGAALAIRWPAELRRLLAFADPAGAATVSMSVCGALYDAPGATVIGALIERSSDPSHDMKGISGLMLMRGGYWRDDDGAYRVPGRPDFMRQTVFTQAYTGLAYRRTEAEALAGWDGEGAFALDLPPGSPFQVDGPAWLGLEGARRSGTTPGTPLPPFDPQNPHAAPSQAPAIALPPTFVAPIFYATDARLTIRAPGLAGGTAIAEGTLDGQAVRREAAADGPGVFRLAFGRRADGAPQRFVLTRLEAADGTRDGQGRSASLPVGGQAEIALEEAAGPAPELPK